MQAGLGQAGLLAVGGTSIQRPAPVLCAEPGQSIKCPSQAWAVLIKLQRALW